MVNHDITDNDLYYEILKINFHLNTILTFSLYYLNLKIVVLKSIFDGIFVYIKTIGATWEGN